SLGDASKLPADVRSPLAHRVGLPAATDSPETLRAREPETLRAREPESLRAREPETLRRANLRVSRSWALRGAGGLLGNRAGLVGWRALNAAMVGPPSSGDSGTLGFRLMMASSSGRLSSRP